MITRPKNDIVEIFGYSPDDLTQEARSLWKLNACPFVAKSCSKHNHDQTVVYGTCSVTTASGNCIICPNRIYENNYASLRKIAVEVFGQEIPFLMFNEYIEKRNSINKCIVALGQNSGKEVKLGKELSMDWVLAKVENGDLTEYVGVEVQSIDITNNYRDTWYAYKNISATTTVIPRSEHGMNWANVHKRLIPQLIRKGIVYSRSELVKAGLYFVVPEVVYQKFEDVVGKDIPQVSELASNVITVHTYDLSEPVPHGKQRELVLNRTIRFTLEEFSERFITGANLPSGKIMDNAVRKVLGFL